MASILFYWIRSGFPGQDINYFGGIFKLLGVEQLSSLPADSYPDNL